MALFLAVVMYSFDLDWGRKYPRLFERMKFGGVLVTLAIAVLLLLFNESSLESVLGHGGRPVLFILYFLLFAGTVLFIKRPVAGKWNGL